MTAQKSKPYKNPRIAVWHHKSPLYPVCDLLRKEIVVNIVSTGACYESKFNAIYKPKIANEIGKQNRCARLSDGIRKIDGSLPEHTNSPSPTHPSNYSSPTSLHSSTLHPHPCSVVRIASVSFKSPERGQLPTWSLA